jgi:nitrite reductase (NADH) small subunit
MSAVESSWHRVATTAELRRARSVVVSAETSGASADVVVFWNAGEPVAMANLCVHRERELAKSNIFQGKVICPGHQWAFDTATGYCTEKERTQPVYAVRVDGDEVFVDLGRPVNADAVAAEA